MNHCLVLLCQIHPWLQYHLFYCYSEGICTGYNLWLHFTGLWQTLLSLYWSIKSFYHKSLKVCGSITKAQQLKMAWTKRLCNVMEHNENLKLCTNFNMHNAFRYLSPVVQWLSLLKNFTQLSLNSGSAQV